MHIYELRINDKKNETKIFWFSSVEELERVTREQIKQGARNICWEKHTLPTAMLALVLPAQIAKDKKQIKQHLKAITSIFKNKLKQAQSIEIKSEEQR